MTISFQSKGDFKRTGSFLERLRRRDIYNRVNNAAQRGVQALSSATPSETGVTANSWSYKIKMGMGFVAIDWFNSNTNDGLPIAILIQYGHGTGTGGYVPGRDYINPAMRPVFDQISNDVWKAVTSE